MYRFEGFELDPARRELRQEGVTVKVEPQVYALLALLIRNHGEIVTKADINDKIWGGREVSESALSSRIRSVRKVIGDSGSEQRLIKTIPNQGFTYIGTVEDLTAPTHDARSEPVSSDESHKDRKDLRGGSTDSSKTIAASFESIQKDINNLQGHNKPAAKMNALVPALLLLLTLAIGFIAIRSFSPSPQSDQRLAVLPTPEASIAVLSFTDMSASKDQQFFADGLAEEILNTLAQHEGLKVASRTSSFSFRNGDTQINDIGRALGVKFILEGSVRQDANQLRVTAQLIDTTTDQHIWSRNYDHEINPNNLFQIQETISREISQEVSTHFGISPLRLTGNAIPREAREAFQRGNALRYSRSADDLDGAIKQYRKAISLYPDYTLAYTALATTHGLTYRYKNEPRDAVIAAMRTAIDRAMALQPDLPETLAASANLAFLEEQFEDAIQLSDQAIENAPNYTQAMIYKGDALMKLGRYQEAVTTYEDALSRDALSPHILNGLSEARIYDKNAAGALEAALANLHWNPDVASALDMSSFLLWNKGDYTRSHEILKKAYQLTPDDIYVISDLIYMYIDIGLNDAASGLATSNYSKAFYHALVGDEERAHSYYDTLTNSIENDEVAYLLRDYDKAAALMDGTLLAEKILDLISLRMTDGDWMTKVCFVFKQVSHAREQEVCEKLNQFYDEKSPDDFPMVEDIFGGAAWQMINNNPDEALLWIDHLIERKLAFLKLTTQPVFAPLENHPGFAARLQRIEINAQHHKNAIKDSVVKL